MVRSRGGPQFTQRVARFAASEVRPAASVQPLYIWEEFGELAERSPSGSNPVSCI
jgi:hypothetical protein